MATITSRFRGIVDRLFWKRSFRRQRRIFAAQTRETIDGIRNQRCFCDYTRVRLKGPLDTCENIAHRLARMSPKRREDVGQLQAQHRRLQDVRNQFRNLVQADEESRTTSEEIRQKLAETLTRATAIKGKLFQSDCDRLAHDCRRNLQETPRRKNLTEMRNFLHFGRETLHKLEALVSRAENLITEVPKLKQEFERIDPEAVSLSVGLQEDYQGLRSEVERLEGALRNGNYAQGIRISVSLARQKAATIICEVDTYTKRAQDEIALWLDVVDVVRELDLRSFPSQMGPHDVQRWYGTRVKLEEYANARAEVTCTINGGILKKEDSRLALKWSQIQNESKLRSFVKAVSERSTLLPR